MKRSAPLKRTPMKRSSSLRMAGPAKALIKQKKCKACRAPFFPASSWQTHCRSEACAVAAAEAIAAKRQRAEKREHQAKLDDSKPLQHWLKLTERVVNHYILTRDAAYGCISCGTRSTVQWEAGHFLSVGSHPELRYHPGNINKQCHRCNVQFSGNQAAYRIGLVERHGLPLVEELEGPHPTAKYTRDGLAEIRKHFAAETRKLKRANS